MSTIESARYTAASVFASKPAPARSASVSVNSTTNNPFVQNRGWSDVGVCLEMTIAGPTPNRNAQATMTANR